MASLPAISLAAPVSGAEAPCACRPTQSLRRVLSDLRLPIGVPKVLGDDTRPKSLEHFMEVRGISLIPAGECAPSSSEGEDGHDDDVPLVMPPGPRKLGNNFDEDATDDDG